MKLSFFNFKRKETSPSVAWDNKIAECIKLSEENCDIVMFQRKLNILNNRINCPSGGENIVNYPRKDLLAKCFSLMLEYDWTNDNDFRELWAVKGFYCMSRHMYRNRFDLKGLIECSVDMFKILCLGKDSLSKKINNILMQARIRLIETGESVFDDKDFIGGSDYLIREFSYLCATLISEAEGNSVIPEKMQSAFLEAKNDSEFIGMDIDDILATANDIALIMESEIKEV